MERICAFNHVWAGVHSATFLITPEATIKSTLYHDYEHDSVYEPKNIAKMIINLPYFIYFRGFTYQLLGNRLT